MDVGVFIIGTTGGHIGQPLHREFVMCRPIEKQFEKLVDIYTKRRIERRVVSIGGRNPPTPRNNIQL
jgi:translation initiation factor 1 (eIF-1/SUI1)